MKRTHGEMSGHYAGQVIDFALRYWFRLIVSCCALSVAYSAHTFVHRFNAFSGYIYEQMEKRNEIPATPSEPSTVN